MADNELLIKINADAKNAIKAFDDIRSQTEDLEKGLKTVATYAGVGFAALTAEIGLSAHAFGEAENANRSLTNALQNQGIYSVALANNYKAQAAAIQELTGYDDDAVIKGQALLQRFIGQREVTTELTQAAVELAAKMGGDVSGGFQVLGQAINGNVRVLKQYGITLEEGLTKSERMARITELVTQRLGGQAAAASEGLGVFKKVSAEFSDIQEIIGQHFTPAIVAAGEALVSFFRYVKSNPALLDLIAGLVGGAAVITGLITVFTALTPVLLAASAAAGVFGVTLSAALGPIGLVALALTALGVASGVYAANAGSAKDATAQLDKEIARTSQNLEIIRGRLNDPIARFFSPNLDKEFEETKNHLDELQAKKEKLAEATKTKEEENTSGDAKQALAAKEAALEAAKEKRQLDARRAAQEVIKAENEHASADYIALKQQEAAELQQLATEDIVATQALLQEKYNQTLALEADQHQQDLERKVEYAAEEQAIQDELNQYKIDQAEVFRVQDTAALEAKLLSDKEVERKIATDIANQRTAARNAEKEDRIKYGQAVATINGVLHSSEIAMAKQVSGELIELQQSRNSTLKTIGKAAAVTSIVIKTAESAMNIYEGFSTIPIIGPALGVAGAAAAIAFGAEKVSNVVSAADGGLITGGIPGKDSVHALLMPGETVVPTKNFEEVVTGVQTVRSGGAMGDEATALLTSIDQKLSQPAQQYVFQGDLMADDTYIDRLIGRFQERLDFGNARLRTV